MSLELTGTIRFPAANRTLALQVLKDLKSFLDDTPKLKTKFKRVKFKKESIGFDSERYSFHIASKPLHIFINVVGSQTAIAKASTHIEIILAFLNTLEMKGLSRFQVFGDLTDKRPFVGESAGLVDKRGLAQLGSRLKTTVVPAGQIFLLKWQGRQWMVVTTGAGKKKLMGLFFNFEQRGDVPSDLITSVFKGCIQLRRKITSSLRGV